MTRRVFVGQSLAAGSAVVLARSLPAWAAEAEDGTIERMGRIAFDPEMKKTWISLLHVGVRSRPIITEFGPTRVSEASDRIDLIPGGLAPEAKRINVSAGLPHAKLDPRLDARNGRVGVTWCGMDLDSKQWTVYASVFSDRPKTPVAVAGGGQPALHPEIALDPRSERAYVVFEDWSDGAIKLSVFDGRAWGPPMKISEAGKNFRPRVIVTRAEGKNRGALAVAWDSYRDGQYDVYLRLVSADGGLGPELRASASAEWDNDVCLAEDRDGNLWVAWVLEKVGDVFWTREIQTARRISFAEQDQRMDELFHRYRTIRLCMDQTGMGEKPVEDAKRRYGASRVEGVLFTPNSKQIMAVTGKQAFEDRKIRILPPPILVQEHATLKVNMPTSFARRGHECGVVGQAPFRPDLRPIA